ncbi:hypothetical protein ACFVSN_12845 [Kitasatospora sp. NPDC057904]|uniref:hypothetical protein n=1 Tax=Kitasatospora sp. NPDC057904 TaxID=3346275 RepID=UPI0036DEADC9
MIVEPLPDEASTADAVEAPASSKPLTSAPIVPVARIPLERKTSPSESINKPPATRMFGRISR